MSHTDELLKFALENGIIDLGTIQEKMEMNERKKYLNMHPYSVWEGKDGKWYTYLPDNEKARKLKRRSSKKAIEDAIIDFYKEVENEPTVEMVFEKWIDKKLEYNEIKKQTYDRYRNEFIRFFVNNKYIPGFHKRKIRYIDEEDLEEFIKISIAKMELTHKAYSGMRILIIGIFKQARKDKVTDISISYFMKDLDISAKSFKKRVIKKESEVYQDAEAEKLTNYLAAQDYDIRSLGLLLIFQSGLRIGELCGLKKGDIGNRYLHIQRTEIKYRDENGKWKFDVQDFPKSDAGDRYVIINENAMTTLEKIMKVRSDGEYLFMTQGKQIRSSGFRRKLHRVCKHLDIEYKSNHKIRKTYGTMLLDGGVDDSLVAEQMGHTDVATTRKYYYFSTKNEEKKRIQIAKAISF